MVGSSPSKGAKMGVCLPCSGTRTQRGWNGVDEGAEPRGGRQRVSEARGPRSRAASPRACQATVKTSALRGVKWGATAGFEQGTDVL